MSTLEVKPKVRHKGKPMPKGRNRIGRTGNIIHYGSIKQRGTIAKEKRQKAARAKARAAERRKKVISKYYLVNPEEFHAEVADFNGRRLIGLFRNNRYMMKFGLNKAIAICCLYDEIREYVASDPRTVFQGGSK